MADDGPTVPLFIPFVLEESVAQAAFTAVRIVFSEGSLVAQNTAEKEALKPLAQAMVKMAEAMDKARMDAAWKEQEAKRVNP